MRLILGQAWRDGGGTLHAAGTTLDVDAATADELLVLRVAYAAPAEDGGACATSPQPHPPARAVPSNEPGDGTRAPSGDGLPKGLPSPGRHQRRDMRATP